ncbi:hypothetical protein F3Y22_tig00006570pilonHSYRG00129 [Hibiscus syriacus]|uniref:Secoisolariciresinol dehydrogenase n=1 Tax=Hibiscus syriacus TaxID=106335 RepID=A0A6A3CBK8_HIBSY|nr:hypothetical protein F3Y22_tig00006570pilonHSYRG00129 [Hibiscus syriacus]
MSSNPSTASTQRRLEGKVTLITGGAGGIGDVSREFSNRIELHFRIFKSSLATLKLNSTRLHPTTRLFIQHGAKVVADIQDDHGQALVQELGEENISYVHCDVTSDSDVENAVGLAVSKYGKLDIMFNNDDMSSPDLHIVTSNDDKFKKVLDVNIFGGYLGAKHSAKVVIPAKKGCVLFTTSVFSVIVGTDAGHAYVTSKHALVGLAKNLGVELGQHGIRVKLHLAARHRDSDANETVRQHAQGESGGADCDGVELEGDDIGIGRCGSSGFVFGE